MDSSGNNYKKVIRSRNGVKITLDDQDGKETLILETPSGQKLTLADGPSSVELIDAGGNSIKFEQSGMTINAPSQLTIKSGTIKVQAGMVQVDAGMSKFSGVVKSDVCLTNSVVGSSYTPGAGNIW
jgi:type 1 fimbria pilin